MATDTVTQLRQDALWVAAEPPDLSSPYFARTLDYLDAVQDALLVGGSLRGRIDLPLVDWKWARPQPRRTITLPAAVKNAAITATVTQNSTAGTFSADPGTPLAGYRLQMPSVDDRPQITAHTTTSFTLDHAWVDVSTVSTGWSAWQIEFQLPADTLRLASGLLIPGRPEVDVIDRRTLDDQFPLHRVAEGTPVLAGFLADGWIRTSHFPTTPTIAAYEAIVRPVALSAGNPDTAQPIVPKAHRRILSLGAALLILMDKSDSRADVVFDEFTSVWRSLVNSDDRPEHRSSRGYAQLKSRGGRTSIRTTTSGLPVLW